MMTISIVLIQLILNIIVNVSFSQQAVNWSNGDWAMACDFRGNDLSSVQCRGEECSGKCASKNGCTHYTWTTYNGGTCWMKTGSVSKNEAYFTNDYSMVCGVIVNNNNNNNGGGTVVSSNDREFTVTNRCPYTVWPGIQGRKSSDPSWRLPFNGGWELGAGKSTTFLLPKDYEAGRIWIRTNCQNVNGRFYCETGDCGFKECAFDGIQRGGQTPATLAEFTINGWGNQDYYDISLVDGYNVQLSIRVKNPNNEQSGQYWCTNPNCVQDLNRICPEDLKKRSGNGNVIGCLSACERFNTDQYCCRGAFSTPATCKSIHWPVNYPSFFKQACPTAYSYAYDDTTSTFFCKNTGYEIIVC